MFSLSTLKISFQPFLVSIIAVEKSVVRFIVAYLKVVFFSVAPGKTFLSLSFFSAVFHCLLLRNKQFCGQIAFSKDDCNK